VDLPDPVQLNMEDGEGFPPPTGLPALHQVLRWVRATAQGPRTARMKAPGHFPHVNLWEGFKTHQNNWVAETLVVVTLLTGASL
jgi:hypothetical protein